MASSEDPDRTPRLIWVYIFSRLYVRKHKFITVFIDRVQREGSDVKGSDNEFEAFADRFTSLKEVSKEIRKEGVDACGLIFGMYSLCYVLGKLHGTCIPYVH